MTKMTGRQRESLYQYTTKMPAAVVAMRVRAHKSSPPSRVVAPQTVEAGPCRGSVNHREYPLVVLPDRPERLIQLLLPLLLVHLRQDLLQTRLPVSKPQRRGEGVRALT